MLKRPNAPKDAGAYLRLPRTKDLYLAHVVAIKSPLTMHLDIYWPEEVEERYASATKHEYTFISEDLDGHAHTRQAYCCHLKGVEISDESYTINMKEAYILLSKHVLRSGGWVLVSVGDVDVYRRILVTVYDITSRECINREMLEKISSKTGGHIAKEYTKKTKGFQPASTQSDYHIIYNGDTPI